MSPYLAGLSFRTLCLPILAALLWLTLIFGLYRHNVRADEAHALELERTRLSTVARQVLDARNWNAAHGGIYVPESDYGRPNPWLPQHERTLKSADGRTLVLMNPAYMSRQLAESSSWPGSSIAIVGHKPLRPENRADVWEREALAQCAAGQEEVFSPPGADTQGRLRLLAVLTAQQSCLRCHTGSAVGDVLGGISVSQDAEAYLHNAKVQKGGMRLLYALLGVTGLLAIGGLTFSLMRRSWKAEETSRIKNAFMARLSHDMRTPLSTILGMGELLRVENCSTPEKKHALRYLTQATGALLEMVRDITDHAALEQSGPVLREGAFCLREALSQCLALYHPAAEAKGLCLKAEVDASVPDHAYGDAFRLRQALGNLVSNAVKFTEQGEVRLVAEAWQEAPEQLRLRLCVSDSGPGLLPGEEKKIFESFRRGSCAACQPGTGLGLCIARTIAQSMGGDVTVSSRPGYGSKFVLEVLLRPVPAHKGAQEVAGAAHEDVSDAPPGGQASTQALAGQRILAAEDNPAGRYFLEQALKREGALAVVVSSGEAALDVLNRPEDKGQKAWDVVLLDVRMPGLGGLDVLDHIRRGRTSAPKEQLVLVYTAALDAEEHQRCRVLRADQVLIKPVSFRHLRQCLQTLLQGQSREQEGMPLGAVPDICAETEREALPEAQASSNAELALWDREAALESVDGDAAVLAHLLAVLREDLQKMLDQLQEAATDEDLTRLRRLAHACKNSAGTMRLLRLHAAAAQTLKAEDAQLGAAVAQLATALREALLLLADVNKP